MALLPSVCGKKPSTHPEVIVSGENPTIHPKYIVRVLSTPIKSTQRPITPLNLPSICKLKDFPNLSEPVPLQHMPIPVHLPNSAPSSPRKSEDIPVDIYGPHTPNQVSVIRPNPAFTPLGIFGNREPETVGAWDHFLQDPTYSSHSGEFWSSRQKIHLTSTDISSILEDSVLATLDLAVFEVEIDTMADFKKAAEAVKEMELKVRDKCDDVDLDLIDARTAPSMQKELQDIADEKDRYRNAVRKLLVDFSSSLTEPEKLKLVQC